MSSENGWRLIEAQVQNFRRIRLAGFKPKTPVNIITGPNSAGKSSFIKGLLNALRGGGSAGVDVVHHGENEATITVHLSNGDAHLYVKKTHDRNGTWDLEVRESPDGRKLKHGSTVLKQIVGMFPDLSALVNTDGPGRIDMMLTAAGKKDELDALNAEDKELREKRERKGTLRRDKAGELEGLPLPGKDVPDKPVDTGDLLKERQKLEAVKESNERIRLAQAQRREKVEAARGREQEREAEIVRISNDLKHIREWMAKEMAAIEEADTAIAQLEEPDFTAIDKQIAGATELNQAVADKQRYNRVATEHGQINAEWQAFTAQIANVGKKKRDLLASIDWPYPNMGISEEHKDLTVNGSLWCNLGDAETVNVSTHILMELNHDFKFAVIRGAEWFTDETQQIVNNLAIKHGFYVLIEQPGDYEDAALVIEDGVAVAGSAVADD
jgi:DNA repair exonuclease SbcCD ATPase subunit